MMLRQLSIFFAAGLCLFGLKQLVWPEHAQPMLSVQVAPGASQPEIEQAIDEALLIDLALAQGGALLDPVVREQLLTSMRIDTGELAEADTRLLERALALGLHKVDPVVRQRLAYQGEQLLSGRLRAQKPSDAELQSYLEQHAARYLEPARFSFAHVFVSRARFGDKLAVETQARGEKLAELSPSPEQAFQHSDPTILPLQIKRASQREVAARFGDSFASALEKLEPGSFRGPLSSSFGEHFVFVTGHEPARLPALAEIRARLTSDYQHDARKQQLRQELQALRTRYRIDVRTRDTSPESAH